MIEDMLTRSTLACVGILGGMGPRATVDLFQKLVEATPAKGDQDHLPVLIYSVPQIPDRTEAILHGGPSPLEALRHGISTLYNAGASVIVIACNTAHYWFEELQRGTPVPLLHIADAVLAELKAIAPARAKVGILATSGTIGAKLYHHALCHAGYPCVALSVEEQKGVDLGIALVKAGLTREAEGHFRTAIAALVARGAGVVVLACTEIPVALGEEPSVPTIDATAALARYCVNYCRQMKGNPE